MPMEMVVVKTKDNELTSEQFKTFLTGVNRQRIIEPNEDGIPLYRLNVYTDDPTGIPDREDVRIIPFFAKESDKITDSAYRKLDIFDNESLFGEGTKTCLVDPRVHMTDFAMSELAKGIPDQGTTHETHFTFTAEEEQSVKDNKTLFITQGEDWWSQTKTSTYSPALTCFVQGGWKFLREEFLKDPVGIQTEYPGEDGFQRWLETFFDNTRIMPLPLPKGVLSSYTTHDHPRNLILNDLFETEVRPSWTEWRGMGGEEEARLFDFGHEYRTLSKHVSFLLVEGDTPHEDEWLDLWVI